MAKRLGDMVDWSEMETLPVTPRTPRGVMERLPITPDTPRAEPILLSDMVDAGAYKAGKTLGDITGVGYIGQKRVGNERADVMRILNANADRPFVKRILNRDAYPALDLGNGEYATHKMSWGEVDTPAGKKYVVFPTVLYDGKGLVDYGDKAFDEVMRTQDYIEFDDPRKAEWFSQRYKSAWGQ